MRVGAVRIAGVLALTGLLLIMVVWGTGSLLAQTTAGATLTVLRGSASVLRADGTPLSPAASGSVVGPGDQIATLGRSTALITFFDGSEVELGADTAIKIEELASQGGRSTITLESVFGSTVHRVVTLTEAGSSYRVEAGGAVALVRGTVFGIYHDPATGDVTLAVAEGEVQFPNGSRILRKGERGTYTSRGDFQTDSFNLNGSLFGAVNQPVTNSNPSGTDNPGGSTGSKSVQEQPDRTNDDSPPSADSSPQPVRSGIFLLVSAAAGVTKLEVNSTEGLAVGETIVINPGGPNQESVVIVGFGSILTTPLQFNHTAGEQIVEGTGGVSPNPSSTPTATRTVSATATVTVTSTASTTVSATATPTGTATATATPAASVSATPTGTATSTPTATLTPTPVPAGPAVITVNSGLDTDIRDSLLTLREAIEVATGVLPFGSLSAAEKAQVVGGAGGVGFLDTIQFAPGVTSITLSGALPNLNDGDIVDGSGLVTIQATTAGAHTCFTVSGSNNTIRGLTIRQCSIGVRIVSGAGNTIGGTTPAQRNVIGANTTAGISIEAGANTVSGNYIGTNASGTAPDANLVGVAISNVGDDNVIGGTVAGAGNLISGNTTQGIVISSGANQVHGNLIGTNATGTSALANGAAGILLNGGTAHEIGSTAPGARNVISGNQHGIQVAGATFTRIRANLIGTNALGTAAIANALHGISVETGSINTSIGVATLADSERNVISGNNGRGIDASSVTGLAIEGNLVGLALDGQTAIPNQGGGIRTTNATAPQIGGVNLGSGNYISGNTGDGVRIVGAAGGAVIQGNKVGLPTLAASPTRPNSGNGVVIDNAPNATIGGATAAARNVIGGTNQASGILLTNGATNATIQGNYVGMREDGVTAAGNQKGIVVGSDTSNHLIGGTATAERNVIAGNTGAGIQLDGTNTRIYGNYVGIGAGGAGGVGATNGLGIDVSGADNLIGDAAAGGGNVIANSNGGAGVGYGIRMNGPDAARNAVTGNVIGLTPGGTALAANTASGIYVDEATDASINGNTISGNTEHGIWVHGATGTTVSSNRIGLAPDGLTVFANGQHGIRIDNAATNTTIGGATVGNTISGNTGDGIVVTGLSNVATITANSVGLDAGGTVDKGNGGSGIVVDSATNVAIGGLAANLRNVVSGNGGIGVWMKNTLVGGSTSGVIQGNYIGTDKNGATAIKNEGAGVYLDVVSGITVGGTGAAAGNVISGNGGNGIVIDGSGAVVTHTIQGNRIGVPAAAVTNLGNSGWGITVLAASNVVVGPLDPSVSVLGANIIGFNGQGGVQASGSTAKNVQIRGNAIANNTGFGISLVGGANAVIGGTSVPPPTLQVDHDYAPIIIFGQANAALTDCIATSACKVDIYLADAASSGRQYLASGNVINNGGVPEYSIDVTGLATEGDFVTVTLTDGQSTSEFQASVQIPLGGA